tara:strand:+ start:989 stop:1357 length:369 start_codon:yes stop_codon:yes gene_type:complete
MNISKCLLKIYPKCSFIIHDNSYDKIDWVDTNTNPKPTLEECEAAWQEIINEAPMKKLREERNKKLLESDKYSINDWPHSSEEVKQAWITYRQALRNLPSIASPQLDDNGELTNVNWPISPS